jgi:hypothetical protein
VTVVNFGRGRAVFCNCHFHFGTGVIMCDRISRRNQKLEVLSSDMLKRLNFRRPFKKLPLRPGFKKTPVISDI